MGSAHATPIHINLQSSLPHYFCVIILLLSLLLLRNYALFLLLIIVPLLSTRLRLHLACRAVGFTPASSTPSPQVLITPAAFGARIYLKQVPNDAACCSL